MIEILIIIATIWAFFGLIASIIMIVDIKKNGNYVTTRDLGFAILGIILGFISFCYVVSELGILDGFWDKKLF